MGTPASLLDLIAHGGSLRAGLDNSALQSETEGRQANTALTNSQIPIQQQIAKQEAIKTTLGQRQLHDEEIQRQVWADAGKQLSQPTQPAPQPAAGASPQIATPAVNPNAPAANASMVPDYLGNPRSYAMELARRGASAPAVMGAYTQGVDLQTKISKLTSDQLAAEQAAHGEVANSLQGYLNTPDAAKATAYPAFYADAIAHEPNLKQELPAPNGSAPTADDLAHVIGKVGLFSKLLANAETRQKINTAAATEKKDIADAAKTNLDTEMARFKFDLMRSATPETLGKSVDSMSVFQGHEAEAQDAKDAGAAALAAGQGPEGAAKAVQGIADRLRDVSKAKSMVPVEVSRAVQTAQATAPIEVSKAVATARAVAPVEIQKAVDQQVAIAKNSPDALASVVDPRVRQAALTNYEKDSKEYADDISASDRLHQFIAAAQSGNKAAPGLIPIAEVRQLVNRINSTELKAAGSGAGSTLDKIEGWFKGHTEGQPIPPDVLNGIKQIADIQAGISKTKYANKVAITNATTGAKLKPIDLPGSQAPIQARDQHGVLHEAPAGTPLPAGWKAE